MHLLPNGEILSAKSIKDQSVAASPGILPSNRPCPLLSSGGDGGRRHQQEGVVGELCFRSHRGVLGSGSPGLEASGLLRW